MITIVMQKLIYILVGIAVLGGIVWYSFEQFSNTPSTTTATTTPTQTSDASNIKINGVKIEALDANGQTISTQNTVVVGGQTTTPAPTIKRPIVFATSMDASVKVLYQQKISDLQTALTKDSKNFSNWIDIGILYKQIGDYQGAIEAWNYASALSPKNTVSYGNLGDLYQYYIKDYLKAESQFKQAVANDPKYIPSYLHLADLYTNSYQTSTNKGELVLKDGLAKNPGDIMLSLALGAYYKSRGNTESAKTIYNEVLTKAKTAKNQNLIDQVTALLNELEK